MSSRPELGLVNLRGVEMERLRGLRRRMGAALDEFPTDFDPAVVETIRRVRHATMTSPERLAALCAAVTYVVTAGIDGDFVECGVWRGGSAMAMVLTLLRLGAATRTLHLFDTFEGMPPPTTMDRSFNGQLAATQLAASDRKTSQVWAYAPLDEVRRNMACTGYDPSQIRYVEGRVEETLPERAPSRIALLRLDTDWYESTRHELLTLYPRLAAGGVLIIDDYGHWQGARRAVDEYFAQQGAPVLLNRIDYTGRIAVKLPR